MKKVRKLEEHIIDIFNKVELNPMEYSIRQASQDILSLFHQRVEEAKPKERGGWSVEAALFYNEGVTDFYEALIDALKGEV